MQNTPLIDLFNAGWDYVRQNRDDGLFYGETKDKATHRLKCDHWNTPPVRIANVRKRLRLEKGWRRKLYALSVCAIPLRKRKIKPRTRLRQPVAVPAYRGNGSLAGKRHVLIAILPNKRSRIRRMDAAECDRLYADILRANRKVRRKRKRPATGL